MPNWTAAGKVKPSHLQLILKPHGQSSREHVRTCWLGKATSMNEGVGGLLVAHLLIPEQLEIGQF